MKQKKSGGLLVHLEAEKGGGLLIHLEIEKDGNLPVKEAGNGLNWIFSSVFLFFAAGGVILENMVFVMASFLIVGTMSDKKRVVLLPTLFHN